MFKFRVGFITSALTTALILLFGFIHSLPDGKLHVVFCDVGQGDAAYVLFPDGRDMLVDGGSGSQVLGCLGRHMPFWDKTIDLVVFTHPQKDHIGGLPDVFRRYVVTHVMQSDVYASTDIYEELDSLIIDNAIPVTYTTTGDQVRIGPVELTTFWPSQDIIDDNASLASSKREGNSEYVLGAKMSSNLNDYSVVFRLRYGVFDVLFTGDADSRVDEGYSELVSEDERIEVLKVPHHGSKTALSASFVSSLKNNQKNISDVVLDTKLTDTSGYAIISVGKNSYGHPSEDTIHELEDIGLQAKRTDELGDIEIISDGLGWEIL